MEAAEGWFMIVEEGGEGGSGTITVETERLEGTAVAVLEVVRGWDTSED